MQAEERTENKKMSLFQKSVEKKYLNELDSALVDKKFNDFQSYFGNTEIQENIRNLKEEEFQEGFIRELFVNILNYTLKPTPEYNIVLEKKNVDDTKKADGAILSTREHAPLVIAVIELKSTSTADLDTVETQAFGYKNHHPECVYVITSNFEKLRFYIQNAVDYLEFDLFNLTKEQFSLLWLCLSKDNILNDLPLTIKESSVLQEEDVTKKLYTDYSKFREAIFENIAKNNPDKNELLLFNKTQKLLDRFLFIFFAEDRLLLPPNSISEIVKQWTTLKEELDAYIPLYDRFKKYFGYMNTGYKGKKYDIFPYNGGLFLPDEILDNITIDDNILYEHTVKLSAYDFETDVDVNILGHIFEHSLAEIENVKAKLRGEQIDKQKTKRKKEGIYYTPRYITKYIVENTVGKLCEEKRNKLEIIDEEYTKGRKNRKKDTIKALDEKLTTYKNWLLSLTILDPACGSGAFLNQALEFLSEEHKKMDELKSHLSKQTEGVYTLVHRDYETEILEKNIYGVDLNEESVEIAKLSLWLRTAQKGRKLNTLSNNIKCGNSLIDDPEIAGEKAFNWLKEFPAILEKGGFDVVIGNPPYVSKTFTNDVKVFLKNNYETSEYQLDMYIAFMEKAVKITKKFGKVGYIVPNSWLKNLMFGNCRKFLIENISFDIIIPNLENVFSDASVDTLIYIATNSSDEKNRIKIGKFLNSIYHFKHEVSQNRFLENDKNVFNVEVDDKAEEIFNKIDKNSVRLFELCNVTRGINPYDKYRGQSEEIIKNKLYHANFIKDETFVPEIRGKHVYRYQYLWDNESYVSYGDWLAAPRESKYFEDERIMCRQVLGSHLNCCVINEKFIIDQSVFIAKLKEDYTNKFLTKYILCLFASKLYSYYFRHKANEFDALFPKIKIGEFKALPIRLIDMNIQQQFVEQANKLIDETANLQEMKSKFLGLLKDNLEVEKITKKLNTFYNFDFKTFLDELKKFKIKLSLPDQAEWKNFFEQYKTEINQLQSEISKTDNEIDQMVYGLYGLTEDEIKIVEGEG